MYDNIKLVVTDIDGTLARQSHQPSLYTLKVIEQVRKAGYLFGLASGRTLEDVIDYYKKWNLENQFDFIIAWNGCELWDNLSKKKYEFNRISKEDIKEICHIMSKFDCVTNMYLPNIYLTSQKNERTVFSAYKSHRDLIVADDMEQFYKQDNFGIMFRFDSSLMVEVENWLAQFKNKNYIYFKTQPNLMEFSHKNTNKAFALREFCSLHDIDLSQCLAYGDTSNDNELLACCNGICMLNGTSDTKKWARAITEQDNENDGCAKHLKKYLLKSF